MTHVPATPPSPLARAKPSSLPGATVGTGQETTPGAQARNDILRASRRFGRAIWRNWSGYHRRSLVEAKMRCLKLLGERLSARTPSRQTVELQIRAALLNHFTALGTPETMRVA